MRVYRCGTRESDRKMAREREKCYLCWFASLHSTLSWLYGLSTLSGLVFKFFSVACEA